MDKKSVSVAFTGDIGFDKYMDGKWADPELIDGGVLNFFQNSDHVCANVEGAMIEVAEDSSRSAYFHAMNPRAAGFLCGIGADLWVVGNNHSMDAGREGIVSTKKIAAESGAHAFGAGIDLADASAPVYVEGGGGVGIISVCYIAKGTPATEKNPGLFHWGDTDSIAKRIKEIKARCRWCVVVAHSGEEFSPMPHPVTREKYKSYLELGADAVVAHHPHVPENYERFDDGKIIFYSLGNFIFDTDYQRAHPYTDRGVLVRLTFTEESLDFEAMGTRINRDCERIESAELPEIFENVTEDEYELLSPLAAKAFLVDERKKMIYLEPNRFRDATEDDWNAFFFSTEPDGYVKGEHMDLSLIKPLADRAELSLWKKSKLESVKSYLLWQIEF